ncbi:MAG: TolC family protein [Candidatus Eremiobacteraeota bacterium]|nr:TolC family protein [Candidatus Eremiobacteraeota bacterium]
MRGLCLGIVWLGLAVLGRAQGLSFGEVLRTVQDQHPSLKAAILRREAAEAWARGAGSQPNPQVRLSVPYGDPSEEANELVQRIEIGGQPGLRAKIARLQRDQADARVLSQQRELGSQAAQAYFGLWSASEIERLQNQRFDLAEKLRQAAERRLKLGAISQNLYWRTELEQSQARAEFTAARAQKIMARQRLNLLLQRPQQAEITLPIPNDGGLPKPDREKLLAAVEQRPEVRLALLAADIHRHEADLVGRQRVPDFEFEAYRSSLARGAEQGLRVSLAFPLWDWGQLGAQREQRAREAEAAEQDAETRRQLATQEALAAWESWQAGAERRDILKGQAERYSKQADLSRRGFEAGLLNLTEVMEAQRAYREALVQLVGAESEFQQRRWEVYWLSGGNLSP